MMSALFPVIAAMAVAAQPAQPGGQRASAFDALVRCRAITASEERLRCFDAAAEALERAEASRDVIIVDRAQVRESRRRLFGLTLPDIPLFGRRTAREEEQEAEEVSAIESTVRSAFQNRDGQWVVTLADGGVWVQADTNPLALRPAAGNAVRVNRGALGTFMMRINNQPGIRVRRQR